MLLLRELQHAFVEGVFTRGEDSILPWIVPDGRSASSRFAVYRNNVFHNFREALRDVYPVIERLVGSDFFDCAADRYTGAFPSESGDLHRFGGAFAQFLASYPPAAALPYLPDTARLEWFAHLAFHAADHPPLSVERLRLLAADDYDRLQFRLHPACHLLASDYPVHRIWEVNQPGYQGEGTVNLALGAARLLVRRPHYAIEVEALTPGEFTLLAQLADGAALGEATARACAIDSGFDLGEALHKHVRTATLVDFVVADA